MDSHIAWHVAVCPGTEPGMDHWVLVRAVDAPLALVPALPAIDDGHLESVSMRLFRSRFEKVDDDLVADRGHTDLQAGTDKLTNDPCSRVRLPRARRTLDGKHVPIELTGNPARRVEDRFVRLLEYSVRRICRRRLPQQKSSRHPVGYCEVKSICEDRFSVTITIPDPRYRSGATMKSAVDG